MASSVGSGQNWWIYLLYWSGEMFSVCRWSLLPRDVAACCWWFWEASTVWLSGMLASVEVSRFCFRLTPLVQRLWPWWSSLCLSGSVHDFRPPCFMSAMGSVQWFRVSESLFRSSSAEQSFSPRCLAWETTVGLLVLPPSRPTRASLAIGPFRVLSPRVLEQIEPSVSAVVSGFVCVVAAIGTSTWSRRWGAARTTDSEQVTVRWWPARILTDLFFVKLESLFLRVFRVGKWASLPDETLFLRLRVISFQTPMPEERRG